MGNPRPKLEIISADELLTTEWPEPEWVVPGLFPVGLTLLAGRPKVGKSWLALQLALAVATGGTFLGQRVKQGRVLYLALEDSKRRINERMALQGWPTGSLCDFMTIGGLQSVGFLNKGGGPVLAETIKATGYRLVIVDTLSRAISGDQNDGREMTRAIAPLQTLAHELSIGLVVIDHHNKLGAANPYGGGASETGETPIDPVTNVLGSTAKAALADCVMGLYKTADKKGVVLAMTGRDVEERAIALQFDKGACCWQSEGSPAEAALSDTRRRVLRAVREFPDGVGCSELAEVLGRDRGPVYKDLQNLCSLFLVERRDDSYYPIYEENPKNGNHGTPGNDGNIGNIGNTDRVSPVSNVSKVSTMEGVQVMSREQLSRAEQYYLEMAE